MPSDHEQRLRATEIAIARIEERLATLATHEDVASVKVWFVVTSVALTVAVATVGATIAA